VAIDRAGVVHMVYLAGEPGSANVFYVRSTDEGRTFTSPVRVNSQAGSAIATGTIRGAQIAIGRNGRVHVAWNGSDKALPKPPPNPESKRAGMPMLYSRSNDAGTAFEPQRNLMRQTTNLDGGGAIAADAGGGVYVGWHGNGADGRGGEAGRRVWIARSTDDGGTFATEQPVSEPTTGVCGCCAMKLFASPAGELHLMYRAATAGVNRGVYALTSRDRGLTFSGGHVQEWKINACPMTSLAIAGDPLHRAWETEGQVYFSAATPKAAIRSPDWPRGGERIGRKHPRLAVNAKGTVLLVWTEGMSWGRGGALAWQTFSPDGRQAGERGGTPGVPVWSFPAAIARADGGFTVFY
jgi:hypothetical protein